MTYKIGTNLIQSRYKLHTKLIQVHIIIYGVVLAGKSKNTEFIQKRYSMLLYALAMKLVWNLYDVCMIFVCCIKYVGGLYSVCSLYEIAMKFV